MNDKKENKDNEETEVGKELDTIPLIGCEDRITFIQVKDKVIPKKKQVTEFMSNKPRRGLTWSKKLNSKCSQFKASCFGRLRVNFLIPPCVLIVILYLLFESEFENFQYFNIRSHNITEIVDGYLVWNSKCHMISKSFNDPSIEKFVEKEKFQACSTLPLLTSIIRDINGSNILMLNKNEAKRHNNLFCCWAPIFRPIAEKPKPQKYFDSNITIAQCIDFNNSLILPKKLELLMVSCKQKKKSKKNSKDKFKKYETISTVYNNVHSILNPEKVSNRFSIPGSRVANNRQRKLSVLILGIDSVSRLNLQRTLPRTEKHLREKGWLSMKGYNKMGENTYPNLMAILTGQNQLNSYDKCKPTVPFGLDHCPILWYNFRNAGYITAYAEDDARISTFNYQKVGFVDPPTDYYLRPYILACEKILSIRRKFGVKYCLGPEVTVERIFDSAINFAKLFVGVPYFGFFWMNSINHDTLNGLSSMDFRLLTKFEYLEREGVMNDSIIIFISDHGMRFGDFRNTFIGWYEERLPFFYIWIPEWFRKQDPESYQALTVNQNRLTSPYDLYETLRDILIRSRGKADPSSGCSKCKSLFKTIPIERGCEDAGVPPHWCVCAAFEKLDDVNEIVVEGAAKVIDHIENIVKSYKSKEGKRLCSKLKLKKIHSVHKILDFIGNSTVPTAYFYMIQVTPGDAKFEATIRYNGFGNYSLIDEELSRIDSYYESSKCLDDGQKRYCLCIE